MALRKVLWQSSESRHKHAECSQLGGMRQEVCKGPKLPGCQLRRAEPKLQHASGLLSRAPEASTRDSTASYRTRRGRNGLAMPSCRKLEPSLYLPLPRCGRLGVPLGRILPHLGTPECPPPRYGLQSPTHERLEFFFFF